MARVSGISRCSFGYAGLLVEAVRQLDRVHRPGRRLAHQAYGVEGVLPGQLADLHEAVGAGAAVQVDHGGAVAADRQAVAVDVVADDVHPAGRAAGDEEDLDTRLLGRSEGGHRAGGHRLVVAQQGAVQVGGDQPWRDGGGRGLGLSSR